MNKQIDKYALALILKPFELLLISKAELGVKAYHSLIRRLYSHNSLNAGAGETAPKCTRNKCGDENDSADKLHFCNLKLNNIS